MTSAKSHLHETPPRCSAEARGEASAQTGTGKSEVGFTLQTLIVTAVFVLAAVGVSLGLLAVTSASSDDFEEAGKTGVEARCAPNEVRDPELEARGFRGINPTFRDIEADAIGCDPVCATWEFYDPGRAAEGMGGAEGNGGLYSSNEGCFAPCYWDFRLGPRSWRPGPGVMKGGGSSLRYFEDNHAPVTNQIRLGVNYRRSGDPTAPLDVSAVGKLQQQSDLQLADKVNNKDGKPYMHTRWKPGFIDGARVVVGTQPLAPEMLEAGLPQIFEPNWRSTGTDPGPGARENTGWEDEDWEVRADPSNKECKIVNIALDDKLICSSEWDDCGEGN